MVFFYISSTKRFFNFLISSLLAVFNNNFGLVNCLIGISVNINSQDIYGLTPLHFGIGVNVYIISVISWENLFFSGDCKQSQYDKYFNESWW
jgi:hypothetical protein